jgi:hypothetical protein
MSENSNFIPKNGGHTASLPKTSVEVKSTPVTRSRPTFKPIPAVEQVKIVTRLIEYFETR